MTGWQANIIDISDQLSVIFSFFEQNNWITSVVLVTFDIDVDVSAPGAQIAQWENQISNQIKSLLLSHHHSTSAFVSEILMSV